jgi:hypothetical protein
MPGSLAKDILGSWACPQILYQAGKSGLTHKYYTRLERLASDLNSSLVCLFVNDEET